MPFLGDATKPEAGHDSPTSRGCHCCEHEQCDAFRHNRWCERVYTLSVWGTQTMDRTSLLEGVAGSLVPTGRTNCACLVLDGADRGDGLQRTHLLLYFPTGLSSSELHARDFQALREAVASANGVQDFCVERRSCCVPNILEMLRLWYGPTPARDGVTVVELRVGSGVEVDLQMRRVVEELVSQLSSIGFKVLGDGSTPWL